MDPNAAAAIMRDEDADLEDRIEAALNLKIWLTSGGFPQRMYRPDGTLRRFGGSKLRREYSHRTAAAQEVVNFLAKHTVGAV